MNRLNRPWLLLCLLAICLIVAACAAPAPAPIDTPSATSAPSAPSVPIVTVAPAISPLPTAVAPTGVPTTTISIPLVKGNAAAATPAPLAGANHLEGTLQYPANATPDPNSVVEVQLLDMTSFNVVVSQTIEMPAPDAKVPFAMDYDPTKIDPQRTYGLVAMVAVGPDVKWATGNPLPVLMAGQPTAGLVLTVNAVPAAAGASQPAAPQPTAPSVAAPSAQPTPVPSIAGTANVVNGSLTYSGGALDPNAMIEVQLRDVSLPNGPGQLIAAQTINAAGQQAPISFTVSYDPARIDQSHYYLVYAQVTVNGQPVWFSADAVYVLTFDNPTNVEVLLQPVKP